MGRGLDMLGAVGAAGDGLATQLITVHVSHIDAVKLKAQLEKQGQNAIVGPAALFAIDTAPKMVLDAALPQVQKLMADYGVTAELSHSDTSVNAAGKVFGTVNAGSKSEFIPGAIVGAGIVAVVVGIGWGTWSLLLKRLFT